MAETAKSTDNAPRGRSPSFPFIPLKTAISRLEALDRKFGRHPVPVQKAGLAWGMKEGSSQASQTLAALKSFGFLKYEGTGDDRKALLTEDARTYLRAQQEHIKKDIVRLAAMKPKAIAKYWAEWKADPPLDEVRLDELVLKASYTEEGAKAFLKVYDDTIAYAGLSGSDKMLDEDVEAGESDPDVSRAREVLAATEGLYESEDDGDGDSYEQHIRTRRLHRAKQKEQPGMKEDVFTLKEGDVVFQWPGRISSESFQDLEDWTELLLRKIKRHIILHHEIVGAMDTEYTDDKEGRKAEERDRKRNEAIE